MKIINISFLSLSLLVVSCFNDKGNYDYTAPIEIAIESPSEAYSVLRAIEPVVINQTIESSIDGKISENNSNFEFSYYINIKKKETSEYWTLISRGKINFNQPLDYKAGSYILWFVMKDKRSGLVSSKTYKITIGSTTYEGWMILGTEGSNQSTRMDMISVISPTREELNFDLMKSRGLPEDTKGAQCFGFWPNNGYSTTDKMYIFANTGGYFIEKEEFSTSSEAIINYTDFIVPEVLKDPIATFVYTGHNLMVTTNGDAFAQETNSGGTRFQDPINTLVRGTKPTFKVAPYIGYNASRPYATSEMAVFFDLTNKRFLGFNAESSYEVLFPLLNPEVDPKFDFNIGMDLVYMVGTAYDSGIAFALLKDKENKYNIAAISSTRTKFGQYKYIADIKAPRISEATHFAFHSKFPLMYYAIGNKVYAYNWSNETGSEIPVITTSSEITMLKFQLYSNLLSLAKYEDEVFLNQQYNLIVASHNGSANGGTIGFYKTSDVDYSSSKVKEYSGFCKIKDVIYRERR